MRKTALAMGLLALFAAPALADPAHGLWKTAPDDNGNFGHVQIQTCSNGKICGGLVTAFGGNGQQIESPNIGRAIVWDMEAQGDGQYRNGRVYAPDRDRTYNSRMELRGNQLGVSGCVMGICRESLWTRVN
ncbi:DUF2147 domain-containing protein [Roseinatronobacter alkalisoli]|uniref:DUF2147 domain-containing protein n=1 Tax=Roseinatronobacter alkalisoli TaxID=3028235 RepID=A0ABT5TE02_9RHOB|nr:DUF2147 domain-containing protein [Roseinatronobacter sp. HJB301]MDD7972601.1 DUF2147 domain-containing protein [Roseinatronobacter sp. HJB301]